MKGVRKLAIIEKEFVDLLKNLMELIKTEREVFRQKYEELAWFECD